LSLAHASGARTGTDGHEIERDPAELAGAAELSWVCFDRKPPCAEGHERRDGPPADSHHKKIC
jgi:hypothetical protein